MWPGGHAVGGGNVGRGCTGGGRAEVPTVGCSVVRTRSRSSITAHAQRGLVGNP